MSQSWFYRFNPPSIKADYFSFVMEDIVYGYLMIIGLITYFNFVHALQVFAEPVT